MTQYAITLTTLDGVPAIPDIEGTDLAKVLGQLAEAQRSGQAGTTRQSDAVAGLIWPRDNGDGTFTPMVYDGVSDSPASAPKHVLRAARVLASGTSGGSSVAGVWTAIDLNTEDENSIAGASLSSGAVVLPAGDYRVCAVGPAYASSGHRIRLYNVTDASVVALGTSRATDIGAGVDTESRITRFPFTLATTATLRLDHRVATSRSTDGFGRATGFGDPERYHELYVEAV